MPLITTTLRPGDSGDNVRELHKQLIMLGKTIQPEELNTKAFSETTKFALNDFRDRYGLNGGDMFDLPIASVLYTSSILATSANREELRTAVKQAVAAMDGTNGNRPQELYWLSRHAVIAGDYDTAWMLAKRIPDHTGVRGVIEPILALPAVVAQADSSLPVRPEPQPPEVAHPENFYWYHCDRYPTDALSNVQKLISDVARPPRDASQAYPGFTDRGGIFIYAATNIFEALKQWQQGNAALANRNFDEAMNAYNACQAIVFEYFNSYYLLNLGGGSMRERLLNLIQRLAQDQVFWGPLWSRIHYRRGLLSLRELRAWDWPDQPPSIYRERRFDPVPLVGYLPPAKQDFGLGLVQNYFQRGEFGEDPAAPARQTDFEAILITIAYVLVPLARAELNRARRQFDATIADLRWVLEPGPLRLGCEFIELPFAKLLLVETLLEKGDLEYKSRIAAAPPPARDVTEYNGLKAAQTYLAIKDHFLADNNYVAFVDQSRAKLAEQIDQRLSDNDIKSKHFQLLGQDILLPTFKSFSTTLPGLDRRTKTLEPMLQLALPQGGQVMRETNPRIYAVLLMATARLEQLKAGFNYLGYLDTYVPPWRFQFLLERARYFAEHAKNAQRDYLNFLSNAEREEFQELAATQNVEMEKSNVRIETARVEQVRREVATAQASAELARLANRNASARLSRYIVFDKRADKLVGTGRSAKLLDLTRYTPAGFVGRLFGGFVEEFRNDIVTGVVDFFTGGAASRAVDRAVASEQREYEKFSLALAAQEATKAAEVSQRQLQAARAGLMVASMQRQAALLRHEFALQNLEFLRNRVLSAEQWQRLAVSIRGISETYLRYAVELAFLAEQAYEFEADKRINVIRFDYDLSEVGDFLAADFLLRDLDTLEQDLIVTQRQRQQQVRYVLSMAREFPEALQEIREGRQTTFSLRLEQLEKRFPGLYNLRIGSVDVVPVALMDATRFSLELTHLGASQVRLKTQPDTLSDEPSPSPLNNNDLPVFEGDGWLAEVRDAWPVKIRVTGPETAVFSGLTRQEASAVFPFSTNSQRHPFEGLGAAAAWQIDFNSRENQLVPGTLADILITFNLSGYHDSELRTAIDLAPRRLTAATQWLSGQSTFPDALYEFNRSGNMTWKVTDDLLSLTDTLGKVRNVAMLLQPAALPSDYLGRVLTQRDVWFRITDQGELKVLSEKPQITFDFEDANNPLKLTARASVATGAEVSWDFGDGSPRQSGPNQQHEYRKPGRYTVTMRIVRNRRLSEFQAVVIVSRTEVQQLPVMATPLLNRETGTGIPENHTRVKCILSNTADDHLISTWNIGDQSLKGDSATFDLLPGDYTLTFRAVRQLKARVACSERLFFDNLLNFDGLSLATNRSFDASGTETTGIGENPPANKAVIHMFAETATSPDFSPELSPVNEWTLEFPLAENPFLGTVGSADTEHFGLAEIQDVVLALEYETMPR
ncbi:MAG TPA: PKD domain-containing protein [Pyrinomonadaceae bacterium]|nr:PKD domain-containing protein [Pyrinomonadaceae bacterium]